MCLAPSGGNCDAGILACEVGRDPVAEHANKGEDALLTRSRDGWYVFTVARSAGFIPQERRHCRSALENFQTPLPASVLRPEGRAPIAVSWDGKHIRRLRYFEQIPPVGARPAGQRVRRRRRTPHPVIRSIAICPASE
jgi:hypothetical protein